jgi:hypothetical protein
MFRVSRTGGLNPDQGGVPVDIVLIENFLDDVRARLAR